MLKLNNTHRAWIALACALWVLALVVIIALPQMRGTAAAAHSNSLAQSLEASRPSDGEAVVGELVNPARVYDESFAGYTMMCPSDPEELTQAKMDAFEMDPAEVDLSGRYGYVVLLPANGSAEVELDKVDLNTVDICTVPQTESFPLSTPIPFFIQDGRWTMGVNS